MGFKVIECSAHKDFLFISLFLPLCSITTSALAWLPQARQLTSRIDELFMTIIVFHSHDVSLMIENLTNVKRRVAMAWRTEPGGVMCFTPTMDQFRDFSAFVAYMEDQGAHKCGVAKVHPHYKRAVFTVCVY